MKLENQYKEYIEKNKSNISFQEWKEEIFVEKFENLKQLIERIEFEEKFNKRYTKGIDPY